MPESSHFLSLTGLFSKHLRDVYSSISTHNPDAEPLSQSDFMKEEACEVEDTPAQNKNSSPKQLWFIFCLSILITIGITTAITSSSSICPHRASSSNPIEPESFRIPPPSMKSLTPKDCGNNPSIARARGCHFDLMSMIWMPHECYDPDLTAEFKGYRTWEWARHENGTDPITEADIETGDITHGWVQFEYHLTHCLYTWKKLNKQVERGGGPIDGYVSNSSHTHHCSNMLALRDIPKETWNTPFVVLYPKCYV